MSTSTPTAPGSRESRGLVQPPPLRAAVALAGALVLVLAVAPVGPLPFYATPLVIGLTCLVAAVLGGRRGALWGPGLVLTGWGAAVDLSLSGALGGAGQFPPLTVMGIGVGVVVGALLARAGFRVPALTLGASALVAGVVELVASLGVTWLAHGWTYGAVLGLWALADLGRTVAARGRR